MGLSLELIDAVRRLEPIERNIAAGRLLAEIAMARTIEKALLARRLLLTGRQTPEVHANRAALDEIEHQVAKLEQEIHNLQFENEVRKGLVSETAQTILELRNVRATSSHGQPLLPRKDPHPLRGGAVQEPK